MNMDTEERRTWYCNGKLKDVYYGQEIEIIVPDVITTDNKTVVVKYGDCETSFDLTVIKYGLCKSDDGKWYYYVDDEILRKLFYFW